MARPSALKGKQNSGNETGKGQLAIGPVSRNKSFNIQRIGNQHNFKVRNDSFRDSRKITDKSAGSKQSDWNMDMEKSGY